jgi:hypothetical protein
MLVVITAGARPAQAEESLLGRKIVVLNLDALGMDLERVTRLETLFRMELERLAGVALPTQRDIKKMFDRNRRLRDCAGETACLATIGKKLGVELVVSGNVAALGDSYVVNIKVVDATTKREIRRIASDPLRGNPDELIDSVRVAAYRLLAPEELWGSVSVLADVGGAEIKLDGTGRGKTPLDKPITKLKLGKHRLSVTKKGYSDFDEQVIVRFQKTTQVAVRLAAGSNNPIIVNQPGTKQPAPKRWYNSTWFYVTVGVVALGAGVYVGYQLTNDSVTDCSMNMQACGL